MIASGAEIAPDTAGVRPDVVVETDVTPLAAPMKPATRRTATGLLSFAILPD